MPSGSAHQKQKPHTKPKASAALLCLECDKVDCRLLAAFAEKSGVEGFSLDF